MHSDIQYWENLWVSNFKLNVLSDCVIIELYFGKDASDFNLHGEKERERERDHLFHDVLVLGTSLNVVTTH